MGEREESADQVRFVRRHWLIDDASGESAPNKCYDCPAEATVGVRCAVCAERNRAANCERYRAKNPQVKRVHRPRRCKLCGSTDHDRRHCDLNLEKVPRRRSESERPSFADGLTLEEIGFILDISVERVRQIEEQALRKLAKLLRARGITEEEVFG